MGERKKTRFIWLDELRGAALISMLIYHTIFQSTVIGCTDADILYQPVSIFFQLVAQILFISIAGISAYLSKNNIRRGGKVLACAIVVTIVTYLVMPENRILFGILHFLGCMMIFYGVILKKATVLPALPMIGVNSSLFFLFHFTKIGDKISFFLESQQIIQEWIKKKWLCFFGLPDTDFISSDYFPIFPWIFLFFFGVFCGKYIKENEEKFLSNREGISWLSFIGRHTLIVYMIHIPVIWGILFVGKAVLEKG